MGAAKWRNGAPQTAAKENGIRDQVAQHLENGGLMK
jgi:hypothetical protein